MKADEKEILEMIMERDQNDRGRAVAPLMKAADARLIDTTVLSIEQVCLKILEYINKGGLL